MSKRERNTRQTLAYLIEIQPACIDWISSYQSITDILIESTFDTAPRPQDIEELYDAIIAFY